MTRSHLRAVLIDASGDSISGQQIYIYRLGTTTAPLGTMYNASSGGSVITNPRTTDSAGVVEAWLDTPQFVDFVYTDAGGTHRISQHTEDDSASPTGNAFLKPPIDAPWTSAVQHELYAAPWGNNSNDGLSWGTAKLDIVGAYDAAPGPGIHIHYWELTYIDAVNTDRGLWLMNPNDPNYGSPPAGWRHAKEGLRLTGHGGTTWVPNSKRPQAFLFGGSNTDRNKPVFWFSNCGTATFEDVKATAAVVMKLAIASNGRTAINPDVSSANVVLDNCGFTADSGTTGNGPTVQMGYTFWVYVRGGAYTACYARYTTNAAVITAGTTARFTTTIAHHYEVGDVVVVYGLTPSGYNGQWEITAVPTSTTFEANIGTSPAAGSGSGQVRGITDDRSATFSNHPPASELGPGDTSFFYIDNTNLNSGGVNIKAAGQFGLGFNHWRDITFEGFDGTATPPAIYLAGPTRRTYVGYERTFISNVELADTGGQEAGKPGSQTVWVDSPITPQGLVAIAAPVTGPFVGAHAVSIGGADLQNSSIGIAWDGRIIGRNNGAWRSPGFQLARYTNLALSNAAGWGSTGGTQTTGQADPFGLTNAVLVESASGTQGRQPYPQSGHALAVGDYIVCGVLVKGTVALGPFPQGSFFNVTNGAAFDNGTGGATLVPFTGSLEWQWLTAVVKCTTAPGGGVGDWQFTVQADPTHPTLYAYPLLVKIPAATAATLTDAEIRDWAHYVQPGWPDAAAAGQVSLSLNQSLLIPSGYIEGIEIADPAAPAANRGRTYYRDNGAGKTQLVVRFPTGAVQVIATEP